MRTVQTLWPLRDERDVYSTAGLNTSRTRGYGRWHEGMNVTTHDRQSHGKGPVAILHQRSVEEYNVGNQRRPTLTVIDSMLIIRENGLSKPLNHGRRAVRHLIGYQQGHLHVTRWQYTYFPFDITYGRNRTCVSVDLPDYFYEGKSCNI